MLFGLHLQGAKDEEEDLYAGLLDGESLHAQLTKHEVAEVRRRSEECKLLPGMSSPHSNTLLLSQQH